MLDREPLNVNYGLRSARDWYPLITGADDAPSAPYASLVRDLDRLVRGMPVRWQASSKPPLSGLKSLARSDQRHLMMAFARVLGRPVVIKDPFLSLSMRYAAERLTRRPVVVAMRHPAAWVMSLQRVGWHPGALLNRLQHEDGLAAARARVSLPSQDWTKLDLVEAAGWAWSLLTSEMASQMDRLGPDRAILFKLESLKADPQRETVRLLKRVGLEPDDHATKVIRELTQGGEVVPATRQTHVLRRDTSSAVDAWRERLSTDVQSVIWARTEPVASRFYSS